MNRVIALGRSGRREGKLVSETKVRKNETIDANFIIGETETRCQPIRKNEYIEGTFFSVTSALLKRELVFSVMRK
jgi:hypothetical protein